MKKGIHPNYYTQAKVKCSTCGTEFNFGSTMESYTVSVCSRCHPFYTGEQQVILDAANKISSFKERINKTFELKKRLAEIEASREKRKKENVGVIASNDDKKLTLKDLLTSKGLNKNKTRK